MARQTKTFKKPVEPAGAGEAKAEPAAAEGPVENRAQAVKKLLAMVEKKIKDESMKPTVGDYIRLVQLHKELDEEAPKEIKVTWVEPETKE